MAIHDCYELSGELCPFAPRSLLKTVVARYTERGLTPVVAPEIEFYLTAANTDPDHPLTAPVSQASDGIGTIRAASRSPTKIRTNSVWVWSALAGNRFASVAECQTGQR
jgi:glutamine synthetase